MSGLVAIFRRELAGLFLGPLAWVLLCLALAVHGFYFAYYLQGTDGDVGQSLDLALGLSAIFWGLAVLLPPLLTMRMISEEARTGLLEFLLTAPVADLAVVVGKLLAATAVMAILWASTLVFAAAAQGLGAAPDWPALLAALGGATLVSCLFCAIGLAASASTSTPLLAAFLALVANVAVLSLPQIAALLGRGRGHWLVEVAEETRLTERHVFSFLRGVLDTRHIVFFMAWILFFVYLATRLLESRRWRA